MGCTIKSLYNWIERYGNKNAQHHEFTEQQKEIRELKANNLKGSIISRGNCHDNAVTESFFQLLKRERVKRKIYTSLDLAKQDIFDYIEMFYNPIRRHGSNDMLSPIEYENRYFMELESA